VPAATSEGLLSEGVVRCEEECFAKGQLPTHNSEHVCMVPEDQVSSGTIIWQDHGANLLYGLKPILPASTFEAMLQTRLV